MSSSDRPARLILASPLSSLELAVVDSSFRQVAYGLGALDVTVPPGIYELRYQAGPQYEKRLVSLAPGQTYEDRAIEVAFPSAAPFEGTSTSHEDQQAAAAEASQKATGAGAALVLMVRNVREPKELVFDRSTVGALALLGPELHPLPDFDSGWVLDSANGWATWSSTLPPGGYALRVHRASDRPTQQPQLVFDQSIWLSERWQTLVFIPNSAQGPAPESATVHMVEPALDWSPYERDVSSALELALWGLREGRAVVPADLGPLLQHKFQNPMLGIIAAHSLLLEPDPDFGLIRIVLENLAGLVPDHPDVAALRWLAAERRSVARYPAPEDTPPSVFVDWPPLLRASYSALIRRDAVDTNTIVDGSVAARAAAQLVSCGVWTAWKPLESPAEMISRGLEEEAVQLPVKPEEIRRAEISDPATKRVATYLADVAEVRESTVLEVLDEVGPEQIGVAAGLPSSSVQRALHTIKNRTHS